VPPASSAKTRVLPALRPLRVAVPTVEPAAMVMDVGLKNAKVSATACALQQRYACR